jgi:hypothetical protein
MKQRKTLSVQDTGMLGDAHIADVIDFNPHVDAIHHILRH